MLRTDILGCHSFIEPHTQYLVHMLSTQIVRRSRYTGAIDDPFRLVDFDVIGGSGYSCVQSSPLSVSQLTVAPGCMPEWEKDEYRTTIPSCIGGAVRVRDNTQILRT